MVDDVELVEILALAGVVVSSSDDSDDVSQIMQCACDMWPVTFASSAVPAVQSSAAQQFKLHSPLQQTTDDHDKTSKKDVVVLK